MPLVIPLTWAVMKNGGGATPENMHIMYSTIACVLTGSVWADHCSPISDTTILTSIASDGIVVHSVEEEDQLVFCPNSFTIMTCEPIPSKSRAHHGKPNPAGNVPSSNAANPAETA